MRISKSVGVAAAAFIVGSAGTLWSAPGNGNGGVSSEVAALQANVSTLQSQVAALQALLAGVTRVSDPETFNDTLRFSAMNVQIVNGTGSTESVNSLGNLIIGYNERNPTAGENDRSGSHVLVVGKYNQYSSYASIVAGELNVVRGGFTCVTGGVGNQARDFGTSVSGGLFNKATGQYCSCSGGISNNANGFYNSIAGGQENNTGSETLGAAVSGGVGNVAFGFWSTVGGGYQRGVTGDYDWVAGSLFEDD